MPANAFVYGTLMSEEVLQVLLRRVPVMKPARIQGFTRHRVKGQVFPAIAVMLDLTDKEMGILDVYESEEYYRHTVKPILEDGTSVTAEVYVWKDTYRPLLENCDWEYTDWRVQYMDRWLQKLVFNSVIAKHNKLEMGYITAEEILLPTRFICKTAHFVAVLTVLFDVDYIVRHAVVDAPSLNYGSERATLRGLAWASVACFIVEYIGLLLGTSIFQRRLNALYILLHFVGTILVALFYTENWDLQTFIPFFVCFSGIPALLEIWTFLRVFGQRSY